MPTPYSQENHRSALQHAGFVSEAIGELTANRCVTQVSSKPFICSLLSVVVNSEDKLVSVKFETSQSIFAQRQIQVRGPAGGFTNVSER